MCLACVCGVIGRDTVYGGGGGGCYGGVPKSQNILPLKSQIPKKLPLKSQIPKFLTPQIPNPKKNYPSNPKSQFFTQYYKIIKH